MPVLSALREPRLGGQPPLLLGIPGPPSVTLGSGILIPERPGAGLLGGLSAFSPGPALVTFSLVSVPVAAVPGPEVKVLAGCLHPQALGDSLPAPSSFWRLRALPVAGLCVSLLHLRTLVPLDEGPAGSTMTSCDGYACGGPLSPEGHIVRSWEGHDFQGGPSSPVPTSVAVRAASSGDLSLCQALAGPPFGGCSGGVFAVGWPHAGLSKGVQGRVEGPPRGCGLRPPHPMSFFHAVSASSCVTFLVVTFG